MIATPGPRSLRAAAVALSLALGGGCHVGGNVFLEVGAGAYAGIGDRIEPLVGSLSLSVGYFFDDRTSARFAVGGGGTAGLFDEGRDQAGSVLIGPVTTRLDVTHPGWDPERSGVFRYTALVEGPGSLLASGGADPQAGIGMGFYGGATWGWVSEGGSSILFSAGPYGAFTSHVTGLVGVQTRMTLSLAD